MAKPPVLTSTRALYAVVALFILASSTPADAVLGADAASISADHARLSGGQKRPLNMRNPQLQAHEIAMVDGSSIREYVAPNGVVFAVAWSTRFKPDLMSLLGRWNWWAPAFISRACPIDNPVESGRISA